MIVVTTADIGKRVCYTANHNGPLEYGVITSFNDTCVFVRYGSGMNSKATSREDLTWDNP